MSNNLEFWKPTIEEEKSTCLGKVYPNPYSRIYGTCSKCGKIYEGITSVSICGANIDKKKEETSKEEKIRKELCNGAVVAYSRHDKYPTCSKCLWCYGDIAIPPLFCIQEKKEELKKKEECGGNLNKLLTGNKLCDTCRLQYDSKTTDEICTADVSNLCRGEIKLKKMKNELFPWACERCQHSYSYLGIGAPILCNQTKNQTDFSKPPILPPGATLETPSGQTSNPCTDKSIKWYIPTVEDVRETNRKREEDQKMAIRKGLKQDKKIVAVLFFLSFISTAILIGLNWELENTPIQGIGWAMLPLAVTLWLLGFAGSNYIDIENKKQNRK